MDNRAAVFIDGAYLSRILRDAYGAPRLDYAAFATWCASNFELFRCYYYDCLPYQSKNPSEEERERFSRAQKFFNALKRLDRFEVREGRLAFRGMNNQGKPIFQQKQVDLYLGVDIARTVFHNAVRMIVLVSGDSDLLPAVALAREQSVLVRLVHGPVMTYHQELWDAVDERVELNESIISTTLRPAV